MHDSSVLIFNDPPDVRLILSGHVPDVVIALGAKEDFDFSMHTSQVLINGRFHSQFHIHQDAQQLDVFSLAGCRMNDHDVCLA